MCPASIGFSVGYGSPGFTSVSNWFVRKRGRALGVMQSVNAAFSGSIVPLIAFFVAEFGWRTALVLSARIIWTAGFLLAPVFRHKPEPFGYLPDGEDLERPADLSSTSRRSGVAPAALVEQDCTARQVVRTRAFWIIAISSMLSMFSRNAVAVHAIAYLITDRCIDS